MQKGRDNGTRTTLLRRVKDPEDHASWQTFHDIYGKLIYGQAIKAGLSDDEAGEAVQMTMIDLAKRLQTFTYRKEKGSFKRQLYRLAHWRITDQLRRRRSPGLPVHSLAAGEFVPAELTVNPDSDWEDKWREALLAAAMEKLRHSIPPAHFQVFDLLIAKEWRVSQVARTLNMSSARVHLVKFRVLISLKREVARLEKKE